MIDIIYTIGTIIAVLAIIGYFGIGLYLSWKEKDICKSIFYYATSALLFFETLKNLK